MDELVTRDFSGNPVVLMLDGRVFSVFQVGGALLHHVAALGGFETKTDKKGRLTVWILRPGGGRADKPVLCEAPADAVDRFLATGFTSVRS